MGIARRRMGGGVDDDPDREEFLLGEGGGPRVEGPADVNSLEEKERKKKECSISGLAEGNW
jgi:hypothetical protein